MNCQQIELHYIYKMGYRSLKKQLLEDLHCMLYVPLQHKSTIRTVYYLDAINFDKYRDKIKITKSKSG